MFQGRSQRRKSTRGGSQNQLAATAIRKSAPCQYGTSPETRTDSVLVTTIR